MANSHFELPLEMFTIEAYNRPRQRTLEEGDDLKSLRRIPVVINNRRDRVILLPFGIGVKERMKLLFQFVDTLSTAAVTRELSKVREAFEHRHPHLEKTLLCHYESALHCCTSDCVRDMERKLLLGAYFSMEYAIEGAALFNPSIVALQRKKDELQWLMSMRATGEGHQSSIVFEKGKIDKDGKFLVDERQRLSRRTPLMDEKSYCGEASYTLKLPEGAKLDELLLFPRSKAESRGMEDLRLVEFEDGTGESTYYGTYTAYDGHSITPRLVETKDFRTVKVSGLSGTCAQNKGMALFPRTINGEFFMSSRNDGRNLYIMSSKSLYEWEDALFLAGPKYPWEGSIIGNCGSPIETEKGWLLLTHAVGPMRRYTLSAMLLSLDSPWKVIGRLSEPLMEPTEQEREGYVPNVLYTCGAIVHRDLLYIPYALSDQAISLATVELAELLDELERVGP